MTLVARYCSTSFITSNTSPVFFILLVFLLLTLSSCSNIAEEDEQANKLMLTDFERKIAQKVALDIRYFCKQPITPGEKCLQRVTKLPSELAELIQETSLGGVVLFAENLLSNEQVVRLTNDLQSAALLSKTGKPLFISIDQEGGRVARLPQTTTFAGNMAIGATYQHNKTKFATHSSQVIGAELNVLGINNNFSPVIDVNTNADNPVINTRSFGENPQQVAELGVAVVEGLQAQGVMSTLKHFPGHGDTHVDSHLALPRVEHNLSTIERIDLAPFKWAIDHSDPAMIMTAHIQYPALDNSLIINKQGEKIIRPATMSRKIITDLLRGEMGYQGVIASDALDMAGIAHYFDDVSATVETFKAGTDLALMPFKVRVPADVDKFKRFVKAVSKQLMMTIEKGLITYDEIDQSIARIDHAKNKFIQLPSSNLRQQIANAELVVANEAHLMVQQLLANESVTLLKGKGVLPVSPEKIKHIHMFVANKQEQDALQSAIAEQWQQARQSQLKITSIIATQEKTMEKIQNISQLQQADLVIATIDVKVVGAVDLGGMDGILKQAINHKKLGKKLLSPAKANYGQLVQLQLQFAKEYNIKSVLIAQGSPFLITPYLKDADVALLTYDDKIYQTVFGDEQSAGMKASLAIMTAKQPAKGVLPVTLL
ncbi:MAG: glycoside hydrolase family 3 protein [Litorilituus sp.]|jgi:beta-N-acetylhexosaminidase|nr:glycoside hydrolase family 3 protein [Litorilituus sp.]